MSAKKTYKEKPVLAVVKSVKVQIRVQPTETAQAQKYYTKIAWLFLSISPILIPNTTTFTLEFKKNHTEKSASSQRTKTEQWCNPCTCPSAVDQRVHPPGIHTQECPRKKVGFL